jgi:hypothetical protein
MNCEEINANYADTLREYTNENNVIDSTGALRITRDASDGVLTPAEAKAGSDAFSNDCVIRPANVQYTIESVSGTYDVAAEMLTVDAEIRNDSGFDAPSSVSLLVDGILSDTVEVSVPAGESQTVTIEQTWTLDTPSEVCLGYPDA